MHFGVCHRLILRSTALLHQKDYQTQGCVYGCLMSVARSTLIGIERTTVTETDEDVDFSERPDSSTKLTP